MTQYQAGFPISQHHVYADSVRLRLQRPATDAAR
jgi:hypothetical protein